MRIIVAGSRTVTESDVREALNRCSWAGFATAIVSGTARGADTWGERWAQEHDIDVHRFPAEWEKFGKRAGPIRNELMAKYAHGLIAVWDGKSRGTKSMIQLAEKFGLRIAVLRTDTRRIEERDPSGKLASLWEAIEERAALREYDGGLSRADAERQAEADYREAIGLCEETPIVRHAPLG